MKPAKCEKYFIRLTDSVEKGFLIEMCVMIDRQEHIFYIKYRSSETALRRFSIKGLNESKVCEE